MNVTGQETLTFGPVPSRRLGRSLGINNIPPKYCSYSCLYCQVGPTPVVEAAPRPFYSPRMIARSVTERVRNATRGGEPIDYLTFVPDGEPTLDSNLDDAIYHLRPLGIPIAVISNGSLIWREDVQEALYGAHWVSLKLDAAIEPVWRLINRPHPQLRLVQILDGIKRFARTFAGELAIETMLVGGVNDDEACIDALAALLEEVQPTVAYLAVPTRPPAEPWIRWPEEAVLKGALQILSERVRSVEYLIENEGTTFAATGDPASDILAITAVHPMRRDAVGSLLEKAGKGWSVVERLLSEGAIREVEYGGDRFFVRCLPPVGADAAGSPRSAAVHA